MGDEDGDLSLVAAEGARDLQRRENEPSRGVENEVQRDIGIGHVDGPQHLLGVVDVDIAHDRKPEEFHRLLTVHEQNDAGVPVALQLRDLAHSHRIEQALADHRLKRRQHEKDPKDVEHAHEILHVMIIRLRQSQRGRSRECRDRHPGANPGDAAAATGRQIRHRR